MCAGIRWANQKLDDMIELRICVRTHTHMQTHAHAHALFHTKEQPRPPVLPRTHNARADAAP